MSETIAPILGGIATVLFVISQAPMLIKAARTKDLASYSGTNLIIANIGNVAQAGYVVTLPAGPVWALHAFNTFSSACMLFWWLRHRRDGAQSPVPSGRPTGLSTDSDHGGLPAARLKAHPLAVGIEP
jgi:uncharacterized protein with PQ loop repeat